MSGTLRVPGMGEIPVGGQGGSDFGPFQPFADGFTAVGLTTPILRFAGVGTATALALYVFKPSSMFDEAGRARGWYVWSDGSETTTIIPWWMAGILAGGIAAVFF